MRERLGIAQAIMEDPELLILDEPFNGLDKQGAGEVCELLRGLRNEGRLFLSQHITCWRSNGSAIRSVRWMQVS